MHLFQQSCVFTSWLIAAGLGDGAHVKRQDNTLQGVHIEIVAEHPQQPSPRQVVGDPFLASFFEGLQFDLPGKRGGDVG